MYRQLIVSYSLDTFLGNLFLKKGRDKFAHNFDLCASGVVTSQVWFVLIVMISQKFIFYLFIFYLSVF